MSKEDPRRMGRRKGLCDYCNEDYKQNNSLQLNLRYAQLNKYRNWCMICGVPLSDDNLGDCETVEKCKENRIKNNSNTYWKIILSLAALFIFCIVACIVAPELEKGKAKTNKVNLKSELKTLKEKYSNQNNALWQNAWKILNENEESTHSFVLLYRSNGAVAAECFAKDFVKVINKIHNKTNIIIYQNKYDTVEYGEELVKYLDLVRESKHLIVPRLQEMNGEIARMFHTLCDESNHSIRPSYFIFTLEDTSDRIDPNSQTLNPLKRVGILLRNTWSNLLENELHPLISRIVRNVAEISPVSVNC